MKCLVVAIFCSVLALWTPAAPAKTIILAADGKPAATIVTPADADKRIELAANELQHYVKAICGVTLPIHRDGKQVIGTGLYIGQCQPTTEADLPEAGLNPESYAIQVRDGSVYFTGRWPTPAGFAVSSFIEQDLGVRWFAPGELWEHVPQGTHGELSVEIKPRVVTPDTSPRHWSGHAWFPSWQDWNVRNKIVRSEVIPKRNFQNNIYRVFAPSKYAKNHPEYYPLINGKRWIPPWIPPEGYRHWLPCTSNPDVVRLTVEAARTFFDDHPNIDSFSLGQDDIAYMCSCDDCRALDASPASYAEKNFSDRYYKFVNAVAREVAKTHPDRYLGALIYRIARELPETVDRLEDNVFGFITEECFSWWQPGVKEADHELTRGWAERSKHLSRYDYYGMGTFTPRFAPHTMAEQIKLDKSLGFEGMYVEMYTFLPHTAPMIWALAKMQWDSSLNVDHLLNEFYDNMYGSASPVMHRYFDLLEQAWMENRPGRTHGWVHRNITAQLQAMTPAQVDKGMALLNEALSASGDSNVRKRIEIHRAALRYSGYGIKTYDLSQQIAQIQATDADSATRTLALAKELAVLSAEREIFWAKAHARDDLLGETIRGLGDKMDYLQLDELASMEQRSILGGVLKAVEWYADYDTPERLDHRLSEFKGTGSDVFDQAIAVCMLMQGSQSKNLIRNGDFEDLRLNTAEAAEDWTNQDTPSGWSYWSSDRHGQDQHGVTAGKGRHGSAAAFISGSKSATYIQTYSVQPGQTYLLTGWAQIASDAGSHAKARLGVRFHDLKGAWFGASVRPSDIVDGSESGWQQMMVIVEIPEGVGGLVVMPGIPHAGDEATVWLDDIALYLMK